MNWVKHKDIYLVLMAYLKLLYKEHFEDICNSFNHLYNFASFSLYNFLKLTKLISITLFGLSQYSLRSHSYKIFLIFLIHSDRYTLAIA